MDYPSKALRAEQQGYTLFDLTVSAKGDVERCDVTDTSGSKALDEATCQLMMKRAHFLPATDDMGTPIVSIFSSRSTWRIPNMRRILVPALANISFDLSRMPPNVKSPALVTVDLLVDATGRIETCHPRVSEMSHELGSLACRQVTLLVHPEPAISPGNVAVRSLRSVVVEFVGPGKVKK